MNFTAHGVWFTERAGAAGTAFHMALGIWFQQGEQGDGLDEAALREACAAVVARHPALNRAVAEGVDGPAFVEAAEKVTLVHGGAYSEARVREEIERPYDLARGPLARFTLLRAAPDRHLLLFAAHHLVFDGNSKDILVRDLAAAYGGAELPRLPDVEAEEREPRRIDAWPDVKLPGLLREPETAEPGATVEFPIEPVDIDGLTHFEIFLAAVHVTLARYGNAGMPVSLGMSTRTPETKDHIGLFVNEPPLEVAPPAGTFRDYALALRRRLRALDRHQPVSTTRPAPALTPVSVGYRKRAAQDLPFEVEWTLFSGSARNALHIQIVEGPDGCVVSLQHSPAAIPPDAVRRIGEHLCAVLSADPAEGVAAIKLEDEPAWNDTARDYDPGATVVSLLAEQVRLRPGDIAVVDGEHRMTYADLDSAVAELAQKLPAGELVAIRMGRGWRALVAMLAVMRAGSAYLPIDPGYPQARQDLVLNDAQPSVVLTEDGIQTLEGERLDCAAAYVMYTSGSTGTPKGVVVPPSALANLLLGMAETLGSGPSDRWLALTSLAFDISGLELFLPLITGGRVVIASETSALDGRAVAALVRAEGVTHVQATPSGWRVLLEADLPDGLTALCGGEALPLDLARRLRARVARLVNVYGPTETTIWSTAEEIPASPARVTIGRPIANTQLYIVDSELRSLPVGVWGELCIGGAGVARGYLRRPKLTAQRFVHKETGTIYRTGDVCRWGLDGRMEYRGRSDNQLKVRGHRVEAEEIETRLREHPAVAQAAVALRGDQLAGYIVARGAPPEPADLRRHLAETLPAALIPGLWSVLEALPLTANGKLDRAALPAISPPRLTEPPPLPLQTESTVDSGADDDITKALQDIWQEVLSIDDIGPHEDLFDLGGHSLTITRISGRIMQRLGVEVPLEVFFDTPTIAEIALYIRESA